MASPPTWVDPTANLTAVTGAIAPAAYGNGIRDDLLFLLNNPSGRVSNSVAVSLTSGAATAIPFDTEDHDSDNDHSTSANTSRLVCGVAGVYLFTGSVEFVFNATGYRQAYFRLNGTTPIGAQSTLAVSSIGTQITPCAQRRLVVGDFVELVAVQNSGGALNVTAASAYSPYAEWTRIATGT